MQIRLRVQGDVSKARTAESKQDEDKQASANMVVHGMS